MSFNVEEERKKCSITKEEFEANANEIFAELSLLVEPVEQPKFIMVGGQPGSGKSALIAKYNRELQGSAIIIDQDELRTKYPQEMYRMIHDNYSEREEFLILKPYISELVQFIINKAQENGYNIVLESALRSIDKFLVKAEELKENGYETELAVMSVPEVEANISMLTRYCYYLQRDGECRRNTRLSSDAILNIKNNLVRLNEIDIFDNITIHIRSTEKDQLPIQIYSKNDSEHETPLEAFERGQKISFENTEATFERKYEGIKEILQTHNEIEQLEKLELIKEQFKIELEK